MSGAWSALTMVAAARARETKVDGSPSQPATSKNATSAADATSAASADAAVPKRVAAEGTLQGIREGVGNPILQQYPGMQSRGVAWTTPTSTMHAPPHGAYGLVPPLALHMMPHAYGNALPGYGMQGGQCVPGLQGVPMHAYFSPHGSPPTAVSPVAAAGTVPPLAVARVSSQGPSSPSSSAAVAAHARVVPKKEPTASKAAARTRHNSSTAAAPVAAASPKSSARRTSQTSGSANAKSSAPIVLDVMIPGSKSGGTVNHLRLHTTATTNVADIKRLIKRNWGVPICQQHLSLTRGGDALHDNFNCANMIAAAPNVQHESGSGGGGSGGGGGGGGASKSGWAMNVTVDSGKRRGSRSPSASVSAVSVPVDQVC